MVMVMLWSFLGHNSSWPWSSHSHCYVMVTVMDISWSPNGHGCVMAISKSQFSYGHLVVIS